MKCNQPVAPGGSLSDDCRRILSLLDSFPGLDFERCQFQCWNLERQPTLILISIRREEVLKARATEPACQLTGDVVAWDFETEN